MLIAYQQRLCLSLNLAHAFKSQLLPSQVAGEKIPFGDALVLRAARALESVMPIPRPTRPRRALRPS